MIPLAQPAGYRGFILQNLIPDKSRGGFQWRCNLQALLEHLPQYAQFPYGESHPMSPHVTCRMQTHALLRYPAHVVWLSKL